MWSKSNISQVLLPSPKNTTDINISLIEQAQCEKVVAPLPLPDAVAAILDRKPALQVAYLPSLDELLSQQCHPRIPFHKSWEECRMDPFIVSHTSGSTGDPKLLPLRHGYFTGCDAYRSQAHPEANQIWAELLGGNRVLNSLPPFHAAGLVISLAKSIYHNFTLVLPHPDVPPTADYMDSIHVYGNVRGSMLPPSVLAEIARDRYMLEHVQLLDFIGSGGGPLPSKEANMLKETTRLINNIGTTEAGVLATEVLDNDDFPYFRFSPMVGAKFFPSVDGLFEMVIVRDEALRRTQSVFLAYPEIHEWRTKDLYSPHPAKPNLWLYRGRADDIVVFTNGEKLNPLSIETGVSIHPKITNTLVTGQGRFQAALLVEPKVPLSSTEQEDNLRDDIWPFVQQANSSTVSHGKIAKDMIIFAKPNKPFLYTAKGTVRRQMTIEIYKDEIESLYQQIDPDIQDAPNFSSGERDGIGTVVRSVVSQEMPSPAPQQDSNLLELGMDSLQATNIARGINKALQEPKVQARAVFSHPSVQGLTDLVSSTDALPGDPQLNLSRQMENALSHHAAMLPVTTRSPLPRPAKLTVLLTGSTGSLGTYIFHALVQNPQVETIYCLNRSSDSRGRQLELMSERGLSTNFGAKQCFWLACDLAKPCFGLPMSKYKKLLSTTTHILHNAWTVDFNLPFQSFDSHLYGVTQLAHFCALSTYGAQFFFTSSVGVALNWKHDTLDIKIPESILQDWSSSEAMGYAQSKFVAESILKIAHENADLDVTICRVGQIAGPVLRKEGQWSPREWLPSLIASSKTLKRVPEDLGPMNTVDWIPVDICADIIVELLSGASAAGSTPKENHLANGSRTQHSDQNEEDVTHPHDMLQRTKTYWTGTASSIIEHAKLQQPEIIEDGHVLSTENDLVPRAAPARPKDVLQRGNTYWSGISRSDVHHQTCSSYQSPAEDGDLPYLEVAVSTNGQTPSAPSQNPRTMLKRTATYWSGTSLDPNKRHASSPSNVNRASTFGDDNSSPINHAPAHPDNSPPTLNPTRSPKKHRRTPPTLPPLHLKIRHVTNPHPTPFSSLLPTILSFLPNDTQVLPFPDWVNLLKQTASASESPYDQPAAEALPAVKLLSFYEDLAARTMREGPGARMPVFDVEGTLRESERMRRLGAVELVWMERWMRQWGFQTG